MSDSQGPARPDPEDRDPENRDPAGRGPEDENTPQQAQDHHDFLAQTGYQPSANQARTEPLPASHHDDHGQEATARNTEFAHRHPAAHPAAPGPAARDRLGGPAPQDRPEDARATQVTGGDARGRPRVSKAVLGKPDGETGAES